MIRKAIIIVLTLGAVGTVAVSLSGCCLCVYGQKSWVVGRSCPGNYSPYALYFGPAPTLYVSLGSLSICIEHRGSWTSPPTVLQFPNLVPLLFALYPTIAFIRGPVPRWRRWRQRWKESCPRCGSKLTGNVSGVCPECGLSSAIGPGMVREGLILAASSTAVGSVVALLTADTGLAALFILFTLTLAALFLVLQWGNEFLAAYRPEYPQCNECSYDLTGNVSGVCPECGTSIGRKP